MPDLPSVTPKSRAEWRAWLQKHHERSAGVWLVMAKKASKLPTVAYVDAVEEALCFGWIDGVVNPVDGTYYKQSFTPRKPKSAWASTNKARVDKLIAAGLMMPAGMKAIEIAKQNGAWSAHDAVEAMTMPDDLLKALKKVKGAKAVWDAYPASVKKQCFYRLANAKREETRAKRLAAIVTAAAKGERPL